MQTKTINKDYDNNLDNDADNDDEKNEDDCALSGIIAMIAVMAATKTFNPGRNKTMTRTEINTGHKSGISTKP